MTGPLAALFDSLRGMPRSRRGRTNDHHAVPTLASFRHAAAFIDAVGLDELVESWLREDHPRRESRVERPEAMPPRAYLVAELACTLSRLPVAQVQILRALTDTEMSQEVRRLLGFPVSTVTAIDQRLNLERCGISESAVQRMHGKITSTFDPRKYSTRRGPTQGEIDATDAARDPERTAVLQKRLTTFRH